MGSVSAGRPAKTIGRRAVSAGIGRTASRTRSAERRVRAATPGDDSQPGPSPLAVGLPQHADEHRLGVRVLLGVNQQFGKRPRLGVPVELADAVGAIGVGGASGHGGLLKTAERYADTSCLRGYFDLKGPDG
jgi:hypothetical protein